LIKLSNGHRFEYMTASGALGFDGRGWLWDKPLIWLGLMRPELFTIVLRTLTLEPRLYPVSNLSWLRPWTWLPWSPLSCVRFLPGQGAVNKVGLYNPGIHYWASDIGPQIDYDRLSIVSSIFGTAPELVSMTKLLNGFPLKAIEVNVSCHNSGHDLEESAEIVAAIRAVKKASEHPIILKLSEHQEYLRIATQLESEVEAVAFNSVRWDRVYVSAVSPMERVGHDRGKGGVSGRPAQSRNWHAVEKLSQVTVIPVIAPGIMEYDDLARVRKLSANAVSFGAIHLRTPWKPTRIAERDLSRKKDRDEEGWDVT
jgi:dihydroorotate dehydrogenase